MFTGHATASVRPTLRKLTASNSIFTAFLKSEPETLTDMINDFFCVYLCFATVSDVSWVKIFF